MWKNQRWRIFSFLVRSSLIVTPFNLWLSLISEDAYFMIGVFYAEICLLIVTDRLLRLSWLLCLMGGLLLPTLSSYLRFYNFNLPTETVLLFNCLCRNPSIPFSLCISIVDFLKAWLLMTLLGWVLLSW